MNEVKFKANIADLAAVQADVEAIPAIPAPTVANAGKVVTVTVDSSGETPVAEYGLAAVPSELPAIGDSDAGKVLTVNDAHTGVEWATAEALPAIASGDAGKVLTVNAGETGAEWAAASGGLPYRVNYTYDENENAFTCDKTLAQIFAAWNAGNFIYATIDGGAILMPIRISEVDETIEFAEFAYDGINSTTLIDAHTNKITHLMDNNVETITFVYASGTITVVGWSET